MNNQHNELFQKLGLTPLCDFETGKKQIKFPCHVLIESIAHEKDDETIENQLSAGQRYHCNSKELWDAMLWSYENTLNFVGELEDEEIYFLVAKPNPAS